jgi:TIR domain-containing protein
MKVFLSYASSERALAKDLSSDLSAAGHEVWLPDVELFPGDNWALKVGQALQQSNAMVVLLSPDWAKSDWIRNEVLFALGSLNYEGRAIPVVVRPTREIPWILEHLDSIRVENDWPATKTRILEQLRRKAEMAALIAPPALNSDQASRNDSRSHS